MFNHFYVTIIFLLFLLVKFFVELYLEYRNMHHIHYHKDNVPSKFKSKISLPQHQKAAQYNVHKIKASYLWSILDLLILLGWTIGGGLNYLDHYLRSFELHQIFRGIIFFGVFGFISLLLNLPESIYSTFVIENKFGFNKTTPKLFILDILKGISLSIILGVPILSTVLWIIEFLGTLWWLYAWIFLTLVQFLIIIIYPTLIAPLFNKFSPLENDEILTKIKDLLDKTNFKNKGVFVMDASKRSTHGNAYFTGLGKVKRIVFFDTLLKSLDADEIVAVLAHELGHFKKRHILKGLCKSILLGLLAFYILGVLYNWLPFYQGHGVDKQSPYMALMLFSLVSSCYTFLLTPIFAKFSRNHEFEADAFATKYSDPNKLINALVKLYRDNASTLTPDPIYSAFYYSHPPAATRIENLEKLNNSILKN